MLNKAVFLDQSTLMAADFPSNGSKRALKLIEEALDGLKLLNTSGYEIIFLSNQDGVALGQLSESRLGELAERLHTTFAKSGVPVTGFYYCPHQPDGKMTQYAINCFCRKPRPGLLFRAAREHDLSLVDSWVIGSSLDDIEAGRRAECYTVLLNGNGNKQDWNSSPFRRPHHVASGFHEAARLIQAAAVRPHRVGQGQSVQPQA